MLNESKYFKNGLISSSTTTNASSSSSSNINSSNINSLKSNLNSHETSKSHHLNHNISNNNNSSHHHFNLHTFNQYNQPNKQNFNGNNKNFNDYNNNINSINKEISNSNFDPSPKLINTHSSNNSKNGYSSICSSTCSSTSSTGSVNVKFTGFFKDKVDEREKYLTAKYPNHQMALIKKRLKVEFWIDEKLKNLFEISDENSKEDYDICPDDLVDSLLDVETDSERKQLVLNQLTNAKQSKEEVMKFVDELLKRLRSL